MKRELTGYALVAVLGMAGLMFAQPPGRGFRSATPGATNGTATAPDEAVKTYLALSDSQVTGFEAIRTTARTAGQPIAEQLRTKNQALRTALEAAPVNATTVEALRAEITVLQAKLDKIQSDAQAQMVATLTPAQKTKLATLTAAAELREEIAGAGMLGLIDGGRGPGGPGGGGPGGRGKGGDKGGRGGGRPF